MIINFKIFEAVSDYNINRIVTQKQLKIIKNN